MRLLRGKKIIIENDIKSVVPENFQVALDIGTGDGRFIYKKAKENPDTFFIGIDSAAENMFEYSSKIMKKPSRGGLSNAAYIVAGAEELPDELSGIASCIYINLPWGSLLEGIVKGDSLILDNITKIAAAPKSSLNMCFSYSILLEAGEIGRRELPELSEEYVRAELEPLYLKKGISFTTISSITNEN
ncbi:MAG TPA: hypothetical protein VF941_08675 [Clostridia bacterium]